MKVRELIDKLQELVKTRPEVADMLATFNDSEWGYLDIDEVSVTTTGFEADREVLAVDW